jgi:hypothetical protein
MDSVRVEQSNESVPVYQPQNRFKNYDDASYFMSGTPTRSDKQADDSMQPSSNSSGGKTAYGDVDFS